MGCPNSWMVYFMENLSKKWMIWGYPYFRKPLFDGFPSYGSKSESLAEVSDGFSDNFGNFGRWFSPGMGQNLLLL
jgi:hypothetical protein